MAGIRCQPFQRKWGGGDVGVGCMCLGVPAKATDREVSICVTTHSGMGAHVYRRGICKDTCPHRPADVGIFERGFDPVEC